MVSCRETHTRSPQHTTRMYTIITETITHTYTINPDILIHPVVHTATSGCLVIHINTHKTYTHTHIYTRSRFESPVNKART